MGFAQTAAVVGVERDRRDGVGGTLAAGRGRCIEGGETLGEDDLAVLRACGRILHASHFAVNQ